MKKVNKISRIMLITLGLGVTILLTNAIAGVPRGGPILVPEPISVSLFLLGSAAIGVKAYINKRNKSTTRK